MENVFPMIVYEDGIAAMEWLAEAFGLGEVQRTVGAVILSAPEEGPPARRYRAEDPEGHRWRFMERESPS